jgi:hypothetical protein
MWRQGATPVAELYLLVVRGDYSYNAASFASLMGLSIHPSFCF